MSNMTDIFDEKDPKQFLVQVDGGPGTGKSFVCQTIIDHVQRLAQSKDKPSPVLKVIAPTGVAAKHVNGETIHAGLMINPAGFTASTTDVVQQLHHDDWEHVRLVIIDEKSMISRKILWQIDQRLRQILKKPTLPYGGISVLLVGDFYQLTPVAAPPLYEDESSVAEKESYLAFDVSYFLESSVRHADDASFQVVLDEIRENKTSRQTWELLTERCMTHPRMSRTEIENFNNAPRLYFTQDAVVRYNLRKLEALNKPVLRFMSDDSSKVASTAGSQDAGNLSRELFLGIGSRVMVTENMAKDVGVVNGSTGIVRGFHWDQGQIPRAESPPRCTGRT